MYGEIQPVYSKRDDSKFVQKLVLTLKDIRGKCVKKRYYIKVGVVPTNVRSAFVLITAATIIIAIRSHYVEPTTRTRGY